MCKNHPSTAISFESKFIKGISLSIVCLKKAKICVPFISNNLATGKATNWNYHYDDVFLLDEFNEHFCFQIMVRYGSIIP
mmetsp:Transcript_1107/g.1450  ORF Transcript_1107/g.1450 Transcript_1107/m.1450 type:complete len:80 (+) Transcript_1107:388-627(+)